MSRVILSLSTVDRYRISFCAVRASRPDHSSSLVEIARTKVWEFDPVLSSPMKHRGYRVNQSDRGLARASGHAS